MTKKLTNEQKHIEVINNLIEESGCGLEKINGSNNEAVASRAVSFKPAQNAFIDTLFNKIAKSETFNKIFTNMFKGFYKGKLPYGYTLEQLYVDMVEAKVYNSNDATNGTGSDGSGDAAELKYLFGKNTNKVRAIYKERNFEFQTKISCSPFQLKAAFHSYEGMQNLINNIQATLISSMEYKEYLVFNDVFKAASSNKDLEVSSTDAVKNNTIYVKKIVTDPFKAVAGKSTEEITKDFTEQVKVLMDRFMFPSEKYNVQGVKQWNDISSLYYITTPEIKQRINVQLLASQYNVSKAEIEGRMIVIDNFDGAKQMKSTASTGGDSDQVALSGDNKRLGLIVSDRFFQFYKGEEMTSHQQNAGALIDNYFYTRQATLATCGFENGVALETGVQADS